MSLISQCSAKHNIISSFISTLSSSPSLLLGGANRGGQEVYWGRGQNRAENFPTWEPDWLQFLEHKNADNQIHLRTICIQVLRLANTNQPPILIKKGKITTWMLFLDHGCAGNSKPRPKFAISPLFSSLLLLVNPSLLPGADLPPVVAQPPGWQQLPLPHLHTANWLSSVLDQIFQQDIPKIAQKKSKSQEE